MTFTEIHCLCSTFHDFFVTEKNEVYLVEKAFCMMFANDYIKLNYDVLILLKNIYIESRIRLLLQI